MGLAKIYSKDINLNKNSRVEFYYLKKKLYFNLKVFNVDFFFKIIIILSYLTFVFKKKK